MGKGKIAALIGSFILLYATSIVWAAELSGRVIDTDGQPVVGARILANSILSQQEVSDGEGLFTLRNLPTGFVSVVALHSEKGVVTGRPLSGGADVVLKLRPFPAPITQDRQRAEEILTALTQWSQGDQFLGSNMPWSIMVPYDLKLAEEKSRLPDGSLPEIFIATAMAHIGRTDPKAAMEWGMPKLDDFESVMLRNTVLLTLGVRVAKSDPALANELFERALLFKDDEEVPVSQMQILELAFLLKRPETQELVKKGFLRSKEEDAEAEAEAEIGDGHSAQESFVIVVAWFDIPSAESLLKDLNEEQRAEVYRYMVYIVTRKRERVDLDKAHQLLELLDKSEAAKAKKLFAQAAIAVILAEGKANPAAALQLARRVTQNEYQAEALAAAAQFQDQAAMAMLLREAADVAMRERSPLGHIVNIALLAAPKLPELGHELTDVAIRLWEEQSSAQREAILAKGMGDFVALLSLRDKLTARALLEMEWGRIYQAQGNKVSHVKALGVLSQLMADLDFERALEMARAIPAEQVTDEGGMLVALNFARYRAEHGLARRLLVGPENWREPRGYSWNDEEFPY